MLKTVCVAKENTLCFNSKMDIVNEVIAAYGGVAAVQKRFGYSKPMAVYNWRSRGLPKDKLAEIHLDTGIPLDRLMSSQPSKAA